MLYDVPTSGDAYSGAVVNTTTISAECGLLSNASVGNWNNSLDAYFVDVSGLGGVALSVLGMDAAPYSSLHFKLSFILEPNLVNFIYLDSGTESVSFSKPFCVNICISFSALSTLQQLYWLPDFSWD